MDKVISLVTGGAGFIGSNLCRELLRRGRRVICLDNFSTGKRRNIDGLLNNGDAGDFSLVEHDIREPFDIYCDEIYNLASAASPNQYQKDPIATFMTNTMGAKNVLDNAKRYNARVLQASTSEVYGDPLVKVQGESYFGNVNTVGPRACYDEGKRGAETLFHIYREMALNVRIARIFNTYGPLMDSDDGRVISNFICQALTGRDITIYGSGNQTRSFCYVDDTVSALILTLAQDNFGPVNIGRDQEVTIKEVADMVISMTKSNSKIVHLDKSKVNPKRLIDDPVMRRPLLERAKTLLGWESSTSLESGLLKTIEYFKGVLCVS